MRRRQCPGVDLIDTAKGPPNLHVEYRTPIFPLTDTWYVEVSKIGIKSSYFRLLWRSAVPACAPHRTYPGARLDRHLIRQPARLLGPLVSSCGLQTKGVEQSDGTLK